MNDTFRNPINGESIKMDSIPLPSFLKGCLWSYDLDALDIQKDFKRITLLTDKISEESQNFFSKEGFQFSKMIPMRLHFS